MAATVEIRITSDEMAVSDKIPTDDKEGASNRDDLEKDRGFVKNSFRRFSKRLSLGSKCFCSISLNFQTPSKIFYFSVVDELFCVFCLKCKNIGCE